MIGNDLKFGDQTVTKTKKGRLQNLPFFVLVTVWSPNFKSFPIIPNDSFDCAAPQGSTSGVIVIDYNRDFKYICRDPNSRFNR